MNCTALENRHRPILSAGVLLRSAFALTLISAGATTTAFAANITIGWTSYPADIPVIADAIDGAKNMGKEMGVNVEFALSAGAAAQANAMDNLIALGVNVIAIDPEELEGHRPVGKES